MKKNYLFLLLFFAAIFNSLAQTGPAGIGTFDGSIGPRNVLWLRADAGVATSGGFVDSWADQTTNGLNASQGSAGLRPSFDAANAAFNGLPSMNFLPGAAANYHLAVPDNDLLDDSPGMSFFMVLNPTTNGTQGILNKRTDAGVNQAYRIYRNGGNILSNISNGANATITMGNSANIFSSVYDQSLAGNKYNLFVNSTTNASSNVTTTLPNRASPLYIGNFDLTDTRSFNGDIAEIIIYNDALNGAERVIVENYLSQKYDLAIGANDFFSSGDALFNNDLTGIGTANGSDKSSVSGFSDALQIEEVGGTLNAANEFIMFAHDGVVHDQTSVANITDPDITDRWARSWYLEVTGGVSAELRFDFATAGFANPGSASDYVLLYRATTAADFTRVLANSFSIENTSEVVVDLSNLELPTGYYTLGRGTQIVNTTYYSFQSGDWEDPETWTTDPSGALLEPITGNLPTSGDNMVILSGRTVTMATDDNDGINLTVDGVLQIENTVDHNYFSIAGNGTISIEGAGGVDNFPTGSTAAFADPVVGGTVLIEAGNFDLDVDRTYNNVILDLASPTNSVTLLADYTINGDLTIQSGDLQINDNASTTSLTIDVFGDVQVDASGEINVGTANARHQFNFYGDFTNNGRAEFTNRVAPNNNTEATNGIVDANFLADDADQTIDCNGITNFYRIEIDKGADETYILDINALSAANFNLFGYVNQGHPSTAQLTTNTNALGLLRGTVRLNANVDVPLLNNTGNYNISEAARLWVNGGSTLKTGGAAIVPYGIIQVSDGTLDAPVSSGITTRDNGTIIVEGGVVTVNQIRTSVLGNDNIGGYFQSGGTVNVTGQAVQQNYYTFSLTYPGNTFNMSGGTLRVAGSDNFNDNTASTSGQIHGGGIFIDSDPGNISVTGGTVIMENNTNINFKVTSKAPFWNVIMRSTGGTATDVDLASGTSGDNAAGEFETILNPELLVLNDLTIETGVVFDHNGFDVEIGSDFTIQAGADYFYDAGTPNTTTINGVDDATLTFLNRTGGSGDEQTFWNLIIDKPTDRTVFLASGKSNVNGSNNNLLNVDGRAFKVLSGTLDNGLYSIRIFADSLVNYDVLGVYDPDAPAGDASANGNNDFIKLTDQPIILVTADTSRFGNVRFNNTNDIVTLTSDVYIERFQYRFGRMNLGEHNLKIDALDINLRADRTDWNGCGGCFSVEDMFITDGNASDGGLSLYVPADGLDPEDGNAIFDFPFGIGTDGVDADVDTGSGTGNSKYTPAQVSVSGVTDDGYITFRPVDNILATSEPSGDILSYYWRVNFEDFSVLPTVEYQFTYYDEDLDGSVNESLFAAGSVLEMNPFTRSYEDDPAGDGSGSAEGVDDAANTITVNGFTDTGFLLEEASYTAGQTTRFVGAPDIFYTRNAFFGSPGSCLNGCAIDAIEPAPNFGCAGIQWDYDDGNDGTYEIWSTTGHGGAIATSLPGAGDVVIINQCGKIVVSDEAVTFARIEILSGGGGLTFDTDTNTDSFTSDIGIVTGGGLIRFDLRNGGSLPSLPSGDFGSLSSGFVSENSSIFSFRIRDNANYAVPAGINIYPNVTFFSASSNTGAYRNPGSGDFNNTRIFTLPPEDLTINGNLTIQAGARVRTSTATTGDVIVIGNMNLGTNPNPLGRIGTLQFQNSGTARHFIVEGNITVRNGNHADGDNDGFNDFSRIEVLDGGSSSLVHKLIARGDIALLDEGQIDLVGDNAVAILELQGASDNTFSQDGSSVDPILYQIVMNKGSNSTNSFSFNDNINLQGLAAGVHPIEVLNGTLILNDPALDVTIADATVGNFRLPNTLNPQASSGSGRLELQEGTLRIQGVNTGLILDGNLSLTGPNALFDLDDTGNNNFIEYSASGNALIEISDGVLNVGSQIRGITSAETGVLRYRQTGGDVRIGTQAGPENSRGMLQIYNTGSEFTFTGGTLQIERHQNAPSVAALFLNPDDSDVTETIQIFNGNTPAGENDFRINSVIPIANLLIDGSSGNNPAAELDINALTVQGDLTITAGATLNGNARTLTIGGNLDNDGTYDAGGNETIFNSTGVQQITGSGTNTFFDFTKSETGTLDLTNAIDVGGLFTISDGVLSDNGSSITLAGDAVIDGTHSSTGGNGLIFSGGASQELRRSSAGTGALGVISVDNASGLTIPDGNGYDFNIDGGLRLENGVFNVGGSEILLGINAEIEEVNTFGVSNMIRTNSSFTDGGVGKVFAAGVRPDFIFPIGQTFYTPVTFDFGDVGTTSGTINILPANEVHPTINDGVPDPVLPLATGDINNALQYYWTVRTSGLTGFTADMTLEYDQSDVLTAEPGLDEDDYIAARILSQNNPTFLINKFTTTEVFEPNTITFNFPGVDSESISGDYFAGIDQAIPNNVLTYIVQGAGGDANTEVYDLDVPGVGNYPSGSVIIIPSGATLTLPLGADGMRLYAMEIQDGGVLEIDNSTNHRLGELSGTGTMRILSDGINANTPAFAGNFFSCAGGGLEYGGSGNYGVMSGITQVRNLSFIGSGTKTFANNNVQVCEDMVVNGPDLNNPSNSFVRVDGNTTLQDGTFFAGTGTVTFNGDVLVDGGTYDHQAGGISNFFGDVLVQSGLLDQGTAGSLNYYNDITILPTGAFIGGSGGARTILRGSSTLSISGDFTGTARFNRLDLTNPGGYIKTNGDIEISNNVRFFNGIFSMSGNDFIFGSSASIDFSSSAISYINGRVLKTLTGGSFTFPTGSADRWRPASVNSVSDGGLTWSAQFFAANAAANENAAPNDVLDFTPTDPTILTLAENEYWKISDDAGAAPPPGVTATVGLSWGVESDVSSVFAEREELEVMIWNESLGSWDNLNGVSFSAGHTQSGGRFRAAISNGFSEKVFTLGSPTLNNPLPITLKSFEGTLDQNIVVLEWVTSSEINNDYFEVQRSADGINFEVLTTIDGSGNTTREVSYSYEDTKPFIGRNYYRLKQVDFDGEFAIEDKIVLVDYIPVDVPLSLTVFPNPTNESAINLRIESDVRGSVQIVMYDLFGKRVANKIINSGEFTGGELKLVPDQSLTQGMYIITIEQFGKTITKRVIINE